MVKSASKMYGNPYLPKYALLTERLKTFSDWKAGKMISAYDLASAGFIYMTGADEMQCFACGHILYNWPISSDPLEQHLRLLPDCEFAKMQKHTPELIKELWDNVCLQSVRDTGYSTKRIERTYFELLDELKDKEKITTETLIDRLIHEDKNVDHDVDEDYIDINGDVEDDAKQITPMIPISCEQLQRKYLDIQHIHSVSKKVKEITTENEKLRTLYKCRLCPNKANAVFLPCGHLAVCLECTKKRKGCARCGILIRGIVKVYTV